MPAKKLSRLTIMILIFITTLSLFLGLGSPLIAQSETSPNSRDDFADNLLSAASNHLSYQEETEDTVSDEEGTVKGATRYGEWAQDRYGDWSHYFIGYVLQEARVPGEVFPFDSHGGQWMTALENKGLLESSSYHPTPGDIAFFNDSKAPSGYRSGIVTEINLESGQLTTLEGDVSIEGQSDSVSYQSYPLTDSSLAAYGLLTIKEETSEEVLEELEETEEVEDDEVEPLEEESPVENTLQESRETRDATTMSPRQVNSIDAANYFDLAYLDQSGTNSHYLIKGIYIDHNGRLHILLFHQSGANKNNDIKAGSINGRAFNPMNVTLRGNSLTINLADSSPVQLTNPSRQILDINTGLRASEVLAEERNDTFIDFGSNGFNINAAFSLVFNYKLSKEVAAINGEAVPADQSSPQVTIGDEIIYRVTLANFGNYPMYDLTLIDAFPPEINPQEVQREGESSWEPLDGEPSSYESAGEIFSGYELDREIYINKAGGANSQRIYYVKGRVNEKARNDQILTNTVITGGKVAPRKAEVDVRVFELPKQDLTVRKHWQGGPPEDKHAVDLLLWRRAEGGNIEQVDQAPVISPQNESMDEYIYTWSDLVTQTADGKDYTYYFTEEAVENYQREYSFSETVEGREYGSFNAHEGAVTNSYIISTDGTAQARKLWEGGSPTAEYPAVDLTLWRTIDGRNFQQVESPILEKTAAAPTQIDYQWTELEETDQDGRPYGYYFTEEQTVEDYDRIYSEPVLVNGTEYQISGGSVTNPLRLSFFKGIFKADPKALMVFRCGFKSPAWDKNSSIWTKLPAWCRFL